MYGSGILSARWFSLTKKFLPVKCVCKYRSGNLSLTARNCALARVTIEDCLNNVDSRFALIHGAVKRATQLKKGSPPLIDDQGEKETVVALREIAAGKIRVYDKKKEPAQLTEDAHN
jgi:DNA-directed RNA polymerase omega subunit